MSICTLLVNLPSNPTGETENRLPPAPGGSSTEALLTFGLANHPKPANVARVNSNPESLGMIAGNRMLPLLFAREARSLGVKRLVAVGFEGETDPALASLVDEIVWLRVGQLSKMISAFTERGITHCVMVGQIAPKKDRKSVE